jgi:hypothetical protein
LFLGDGATALENLYPEKMEQGKIYNVKKSIWHAIVLSPDASTLIVENCDTSEGNTDYSPLNPEHKHLILETARREQPDCWN